MPKPDIGRESRFLPTLPAFDAPVGGPRQNIVITFGVEILHRVQIKKGATDFFTITFTNTHGCL